MPEYIARAYFHHNNMRYRVTVFEDSVWVERQTPHVIAGNQPMDVKPDDVLYGTESWIVEALPGLFDKYEQQIDEG